MVDEEPKEVPGWVNRKEPSSMFDRKNGQVMKNVFVTIILLFFLAVGLGMIAYYYHVS